jgi:hypothetical protein
MKAYFRETAFAIFFLERQSPPPPIFPMPPPRSSTPAIVVVHQKAPLDLLPLSPSVTGYPTVSPSRFSSAFVTGAFNGCHQHRHRPLTLPATQNSYKRRPHPQLNRRHLSPKFFSSLPRSDELLPSTINPLPPSIAASSPSTFSHLAIHPCLSQSPHGEHTTTKTPFQLALASPTAACARSRCHRPPPTHRSVPVHRNRNQGS